MARNIWQSSAATLQANSPEPRMAKFKSLCFSVLSSVNSACSINSSTHFLMCKASPTDSMGMAWDNKPGIAPALGFEVWARTNSL